MTSSYRVLLTPAAKTTGVQFEHLRQAAVAAISSCDGHEITFKAITVCGKQFALATRVVVVVDYFPNRVPNVTLMKRYNGSAV